MMSDLPDQVERKLYSFYVRPTLDSASVVWHGSINEEEAIALERLQAGVVHSKSVMGNSKDSTAALTSVVVPQVAEGDYLHDALS